LFVAKSTMSDLTNRLTLVAKPVIVFIVQLLPRLLYTKRVIESKTGWSIFDPVEPVLLLAFAICVLSFIFSIIGWMQFRGIFTTVVLGIACSRVHFLGSLKEKLDRFAAENDKFLATNKELKSNVNQLHAQNDKLKSANSRLENAIHGLDEISQMMAKFAADNKTDFNKVVKSLHDTIEEQKAIQKHTQEIQAETRRLTTTQERSMLMNLFMQYQNQDGEQGLSRDEFELLLDMLPAGSSLKLRSGLRDFKDVDVDGDGTVSIANFRDWLQKALGDIADSGNAGPASEAAEGVPPLRGTAAGRAQQLT